MSNPQTTLRKRAKIVVNEGRGTRGEDKVAISGRGRMTLQPAKHNLLLTSSHPNHKVYEKSEKIQRFGLKPKDSTRLISNSYSYCVVRNILLNDCTFGGLGVDHPFNLVSCALGPRDKTAAAGASGPISRNQIWLLKLNTGPTMAFAVLYQRLTGTATDESLSDTFDLKWWLQTCLALHPSTALRSITMGALSAPTPLHEAHGLLFSCLRIGPVDPATDVP